MVDIVDERVKTILKVREIREDKSEIIEDSKLIIFY